MEKMKIYVPVAKKQHSTALRRIIRALGIYFDFDVVDAPGEGVLTFDTLPNGLREKSEMAKPGVFWFFQFSDYIPADHKIVQETPARVILEWYRSGKPRFIELEGNVWIMRKEQPMRCVRVPKIFQVYTEPVVVEEFQIKRLVVEADRNDLDAWRELSRLFDVPLKVRDAQANVESFMEEGEPQKGDFLVDTTWFHPEEVQKLGAKDADVSWSPRATLDHVLFLLGKTRKTLVPGWRCKGEKEYLISGAYAHVFVVEDGKTFEQIMPDELFARFLP